MKKTLSILIALGFTSISLSDPDQEASTSNALQKASEIYLIQPEPPAEIADLLAAKRSPNAMIRELERQDTAEWKHMIESKPSDFVSHKVRDSLDNVAMDAFRHQIYYNTNTKEYWVIRTGGFLGVYEVYGPGMLDTTPMQIIHPEE